MVQVSIVVPNYNHSQYLPKRFDSIFNQTFQNFEIIILDDCSTDSSRDIIEQYRNHPKVSHIEYNQQNGGTSYKQWYKGIEYAKGDIVWIAESDDLSHPKFLESLVPYFVDNQVAIAFANSLFFEKEDDIVQSNTPLTHEVFDGNNYIKDCMLASNRLFNASMLIFKKSVYQQYKDAGYREMKLCGDWLLWVQIMHNHQIVKVNGNLNYFRKHGSNLTNRHRKQGLDFLEGLIVLKKGKGFCNSKLSRNKVYSNWRDNFKIYSPVFDKGIRTKVYYNFLINEPLLFFFVMYKAFKSQTKKVFLR